MWGVEGAQVWGVGAHGDFEEAKSCGEVEGGVAVVVEIRVLEIFRVVFDYALDEGEVVEVDGAAKADGDWDHGPCVKAVHEKGFIFGFCRCELWSNFIMSTAVTLCCERRAVLLNCRIYLFAAYGDATAPK